MCSEENRIEFIETRDGLEAALQFARQTVFVYRTCLLRSRKRGYDRPHHASLPEYRRSFIESYVYLKHYIRQHTYVNKSA